MIRRATSVDLPAIAQLCFLHAAHEGAPYQDDGQCDRLRQAAFGRQPRLYMWVVEGDPGTIDAVVGYMTATIDYSTWSARPFVHMDCLYLLPSVRRRGIGTALMRAIVSFATSQGIVEIQWQTPADNSDAIGFYAHVGATSSDKARFSLKSTALE